MKRFRDIIQDIKAPSTSDLWINNGELKYYTSNGWKAIAGNDALYPIQGIAPNSSPDLVPSRLCYCHYSSYNADGTANGGCFTTIKKQSSGQYLVDYIEV